jgi:hypothetical protein
MRRAGGSGGDSTRGEHLVREVRMGITDGEPHLEWKLWRRNAPGGQGQKDSTEEQRRPGHVFCWRVSIE